MELNNPPQFQKEQESKAHFTFLGVFETVVVIAVIGFAVFYYLYVWSPAQKEAAFVYPVPASSTIRDTSTTPTPIPLASGIEITETTEIVNAFNQNNFDEAVKKTDALLAQNSKDVAALLLKALTLAQRGSLLFKEKEYGMQAIEVARQALDIATIDGDKAEAWRIIGYANEIQSKFNEALAIYNTALEFKLDNSHRAQIHNHIGHTYDLQGNFAKAKEFYLKANALYNNIDQVHLNLARVYIRENNFTKAREELEKVLLLTENMRLRSETLYTLGGLDIQSDDLDNAMERMEQAVVADVTFPLALVGLVRVKFLQLLLITDPDEQEITKIYESINELIAHLDSVIEKNSYQTLAYVWKGRILSAIGYYDEAQENYNKALNIVDKDITLTSTERADTIEVINNDMSLLSGLKTSSRSAKPVVYDDIFKKIERAVSSMVITPVVYAAEARWWYSPIQSWQKTIVDVYPEGGGSSPIGRRTIWLGLYYATCSNGATHTRFVERESPPSYTHYSTGSWSACSGHDPLTGQGGTQTRSVTSYTNITGPTESAPVSSQSCDLPADFNLLLAPVSGGAGGDGSGDGSGGDGDGSGAGGDSGDGSGVLGSAYSTFVTFIGNQQSALSAPVQIAISTVFPDHPDLPDLTFSVTNVSPTLPSGVSYTFTPNPLTPQEYSDGTSFVANVPVTEPGLYVITVEVSGGGIVKQATVNLNASAANPTFEEF